MLGYVTRGGFYTTPLFGYDTTLPDSDGLYRLLSLRDIQECRKLGLHCHASGGAGEFKQQRGAVSVIECYAIYTAHLPLYRRIPWLLLRCFLWNGVARRFKLPGGPTAPVPPLTDSRYP